MPGLSGAEVAKNVRVYDTMRTAHLERLQVFTPATNLYRKSSYDFDEALATRVGARKVSRWQLFWWVLREKPDLIETNEALQVNAWPTLTVVRLAAAILPRSLRPTRVFYAIENANVPESLAVRLRIPLPLARLIVARFAGWLIRGVGRVSYGTSAAAANYRALVPDSRDLQSVTFEALPERSSDLSSREDGAVLFLGSFESRKGILETIRAAQIARAERGSLTLTLVGKGPLLDQVRQIVDDLPWVKLVIDPPREVIRGVLSRSCVLVLFSQPTPRWREQVGLPIVEGLEYGLEIVSSDETGLAPWLASHGHKVVPATASDAELARAIIDGLESSRAATDVVRDLPAVDSRLAADRWLAPDDVRGA